GVLFCVSSHLAQERVSSPLILKHSSPLQAPIASAHHVLRTSQPIHLTYFPQVEEAIWSEFSGPFHDMKACSGTVNSRSTWRCKSVNSTSNVCTALPLWTSLLRAARLNNRKT